MTARFIGVQLNQQINDQLWSADQSIQQLRGIQQITKQVNYLLVLLFQEILDLLLCFVFQFLLNFLAC